MTYNIVSLFSGAGGMDLGFINQNFKVVWANDFNEAACNTYRSNIGNHIVCGDITKINLADIPDCDGIIGGSPCQGFSNANRQTNYLDNPKNFLVREYIRIVKGKKPKFFVLENVPKLITAGNGKFLNEIKQELCDYHIEVKVLNAADYGVAQKRKRAILIGSRGDIIKHPAKNVKVHKTVGDVLQGIADWLPNQADITKSNNDVIERIKQVPQGGNWRNVKEFEGKNKHSILYRRLALNETSPTFPHAGKNLVLHPIENRILSIRECARIMSFPDDFVFKGNISEKHQQVANAVPPLMAEAIAKEIKNALDTYEE